MALQSYPIFKRSLSYVSKYLNRVRFYFTIIYFVIIKNKNYYVGGTLLFLDASKQAQKKVWGPAYLWVMQLLGLK